VVTGDNRIFFRALYGFHKDGIVLAARNQDRDPGTFRVFFNDIVMVARVVGILRSPAPAFVPAGRSTDARRQA
jgi:hypothetical protein